MAGTPASGVAFRSTLTLGHPSFPSPPTTATGSARSNIILTRDSGSAGLIGAAKQPAEIVPSTAMQ